MKFTVERLALVKMLQATRDRAPDKKRRDERVRLFACAARVFVQANECTAGIETLVLEDGGYLLPHGKLLKLLRSYHPKRLISMEADARTIKFGSTTLPVSHYSADVTPPGAFQIFPVMDTGIAGNSPLAGRENRAN